MNIMSILSNITDEVRNNSLKLELLLFFNGNDRHSYTLPRGPMNKFSDALGRIGIVSLSLTGDPRSARSLRIVGQASGAVRLLLGVLQYEIDGYYFTHISSSRDVLYIVLFTNFSFCRVLVEVLFALPRRSTPSGN